MSTSFPPPMDTRLLLERCMGNTHLALTLLSKFEAQLAADLVQLRQSVESGDSSITARVAHTLSGAAATLSAMDIHQAARRIEAAAREQHLADAAKALEDLKAQITMCVAYLPTARAAIQPHPAANTTAPANIP